MIYASARFKDLFLKIFRFVLFLSADFYFEAIYAPSEFMSLFLRQEQADGKGEMRKILIGKNVGKLSLHRYFFLSKGKPGFFIFTSHQKFAD